LPPEKTPHFLSRPFQLTQLLLPLLLSSFFSDDWWFPNIVWNNRAMWNFGADTRWHNDNTGDPAVCVCKPFTLSSDSILVHHIHRRLIDYYMTNRTVFALVGKPLRPYDFNVCPADQRDNPNCNWVPHCKGQAPAPKDCILNEWGTRDV
jgi:hypothetical protein